MKKQTLLLLVALAPGAFGQGWADLNPTTTPQSRFRYGLTPMPGGAPGEFLMTGGMLTGVSPSNETWSWNGTDWTLLPITSPSLEASAVAYDAGLDRTFLFSGWNGGSYDGTTQSFDGTGWTVLSPANSPSPRDMAGFAYDPSQGNSVLFGGHDWMFFLSAGGGQYGDTWTWDGTDWTQESPANSPAGRARHAMAYDGATDNVILFSGTSTQDLTTGGLFSDMWSWDGSNWTQLNPATLPPARNDAAMAWDSSRNVVVLHGGVDGSLGVVYNDTWEWDGTDWKNVTAAGDPGLSGHRMAYDATRQEMFFFGGAQIVDLLVGSDKTYGKASPWSDLGGGLAGSLGEPVLSAIGVPQAGAMVDMNLTNAKPVATAYLVAGTSNVSLPLLGGTLVPFPQVVLQSSTDAQGEATWPVTFGPGSITGLSLYFQCWVVDGTGPQGFTASNAVTATAL